MSDELEQALGFLETVEERAATRLEPFEHGVAILRPELDRVWDRNLVRIDRPAPAADLSAAAERLMGEAGLAHRKLVIADERLGEQLAAELGEHGFAGDRLIVMVARRPPDEEADSVREVGHDDLRPARRRFLEREPYADPETIRQLLENDDAVAAAVDERCFAALDGERVVSYCRLFTHGRVAQIEDVATLPSYRNRGLARAVVGAAARAAAGQELVFLVAREDDWPKGFYARLGFESVGSRTELLKRGEAAY